MSSETNGAAPMNTEDVPGSSGAGKSRRPPVDKAADFANYFCTYAFLYHQKEMLSDRVRMEAYYNAIMRNPHHFKDKVVLDVGAGSAILALWAAMAGARKVYAVEATDMAKHASVVVASNGFGGVVDVIQGSMEEVELPEKVDVIVSEWMGYFLVRESMFDSVIIARDKWLKPDGKLYPSHARMWLAPINTQVRDNQAREYEKSMADWSAFVDETRDQFQVDMRALSDSYRTEQQKYFLQTSMWNSLYPNQIMGPPAVILSLDCKTARLEDVESIGSPFSILLPSSEGRISGLAGWFDVQFQGTPEDPVDFPVELSTAPDWGSTTHWGQQVFLVNPPVHHVKGDTLKGAIEITRSVKNHRLMDVKVTHQVVRPDGASTKPVVSAFFIE